ncbi:hypothetical protein BH23BAC1_BH23BAC1_04970 [soil metagenome]
MVLAENEAELVDHLTIAIIAIVSFNFDLIKMTFEKISKFCILKMYKK